MTVTSTDVVIFGSGNAALCAAIAAREAGARVVVVEKADRDLAGGNSRYTAGAMRVAYDGPDDLTPLLRDPDDARLATADLGSYPAERFATDLAGFNDGAPLTEEQRALVDESLPTLGWLAGHGVTFDPIWDRQSFDRDGRRVFWGGLTVAANGEGPGLVDAEMAALTRLGGSIRYGTAVTGLVTDQDRVVGVELDTGRRSELLLAGAVVLACGGFEADSAKRVEHLGPQWAAAKVRGTPHNTGIGLELAFGAGAARHGAYHACHATPMDRNTPAHGNLDLPALERKNYRKVCYFLGIMVNADGERFVDEGMDFRNYTYAQFGAAVLDQPGGFAWQLFDAKVAELLYEEYRFPAASVVRSDTIDGLLDQLDGVDRAVVGQTVANYNAAVQADRAFDPTVKDGRATAGIEPPKSNWAQALDTPPFQAFPVTGGITFTYGGLHVDRNGGVLRDDGTAIPGLHACGELVGGVFLAGYPGGSGLTAGAVFGRRAGHGAAAAIGRDGRDGL
ncbi:MAG: FAD-dependent tricarballylate dehydrogenase TcuA [Actinomycetota bacterium]